MTRYYFQYWWDIGMGLNNGTPPPSGMPALWRGSAAPSTVGTATPGRELMHEGVLVYDDIRYANTTAGTTAHHPLRMYGAFLPSTLTKIDANPWTFCTAVQVTDINANFWANLPVLYVWRPSTSSIVGWIMDKSDGATIYGTPPNQINKWMPCIYTVDGNAVSGIQSGDMLICEMWAKYTPTVTGAAIYMLSGGDATIATATNDATYTRPATFIQTPQDFHARPGNRTKFFLQYAPPKVDGILPTQGRRNGRCWHALSPNKQHTGTKSDYFPASKRAIPVDLLADSTPNYDNGGWSYGESVNLVHESEHNIYLTTFVSKPMKAGSVIKTSAGVNAMVGIKNDGYWKPNKTKLCGLTAYVWRPSTGSIVKMLWDGPFETNERSDDWNYKYLVSRVYGATLAGSQDHIVDQDGDVLAFELRFRPYKWPAGDFNYYADGNTGAGSMANIGFGGTSTEDRPNERCGENGPAAFLEFEDSTIEYVDLGLAPRIVTMSNNQMMERSPLENAGGDRTWGGALSTSTTVHTRDRHLFGYNFTPDCVVKIDGVVIPTDTTPQQSKYYSPWQWFIRFSEKPENTESIITIENSHGSHSVPFHWLAKPTITSIVPSSVPLSGGRVRITGTNLIYEGMYDNMPWANGDDPVDLMTFISEQAIYNVGYDPVFTGDTQIDITIDPGWREGPVVKYMPIECGGDGTTVQLNITYVQDPPQKLNFKVGSIELQQYGGWVQYPDMVPDGFEPCAYLWFGGNATQLGTIQPHFLYSFGWSLGRRVDQSMHNAFIYSYALSNKATSYTMGSGGGAPFISKGVGAANDGTETLWTYLGNPDAEAWHYAGGWLPNGLEMRSTGYYASQNWGAGRKMWYIALGGDMQLYHNYSGTNIYLPYDNHNFSLVMTAYKDGQDWEKNGTTATVGVFDNQLQQFHISSCSKGKNAGTSSRSYSSSDYCAATLDWSISDISDGYKVISIGPSSYGSIYATLTNTGTHANPAIAPSDSSTSGLSYLQFAKVKHKIGSFTLRTDPGPIDLNVGFRPRGIIFMSNAHAPNVFNQGAKMCTGAFDGTNQAVFFTADPSTAPSSGYQYQEEGSSFIDVSPDGTVRQRVIANDFYESGATLTQTEAISTPATVYYIALAEGNAGWYYKDLINEQATCSVPYIVDYITRGGGASFDVATKLPTGWWPTEGTIRTTMLSGAMGRPALGMVSQSGDTNWGVAAHIDADILKYRGHKMTFGAWIARESTLNTAPFTIGIDISFDDGVTWHGYVEDTITQSMVWAVNITNDVWIPANAERGVIRVRLMDGILDKLIVRIDQVYTRVGEHTGTNTGINTIARNQHRAKRGHIYNTWRHDPSTPQDQYLPIIDHVEHVSPTQVIMKGAASTELVVDDQSYNPRGLFTAVDFATGTLVNLNIVDRNPTHHAFMRPIRPSHARDVAIYPSIIEPYTASLPEPCDTSRSVIIYENGIPLPADQYDVTIDSIILHSAPDTTATYTIEYDRLTYFESPILSLPDPDYRQFAWLADYNIHIDNNFNISSTPLYQVLNIDNSYKCTLDVPCDGNTDTITIWRDDTRTRVQLSQSDWSLLNDTTVIINPDVFNTAHRYSIQYAAKVYDIAPHAAAVVELRQAADASLMANKEYQPVDINQPILRRPYFQYRVILRDIEHTDSVHINSISIKGVYVREEADTEPLDSSDIPSITTSENIEESLTMTDTLNVGPNNGVFSWYQTSAGVYQPVPAGWIVKIIDTTWTATDTAWGGVSLKNQYNNWNIVDRVVKSLADVQASAGNYDIDSLNGVPNPIWISDWCNDHQIGIFVPIECGAPGQVSIRYFDSGGIPRTQSFYPGWLTSCYRSQGGDDEVYATLPSGPITILTLSSGYRGGPLAPVTYTSSDINIHFTSSIGLANYANLEVRIESKPVSLGWPASYSIISYSTIGATP